MTPSTRQRLTQAAFALFAEHGYDRTTVDDIAARAGVGRTTFFRTFASKEDVIFPDHEEVLAQVRQRLATAGADSTGLAITEAARVVLRHYLDEGELARARYRLTRTVPALRDREVASMRKYHVVFRDFVRGWTGAPYDDLQAELLAGAVVTAHNVVLRAWLRGRTDDPEAAFGAAMARVEQLFAGSPATAVSSEGAGTAVVVLRTPADVETVVPLLRAALSH